MENDSPLNMPATNGARILVVDDDALSRKVLAHTLKQAGYDCCETNDGEEALAMLHTVKPSLLLLDFHMPGIDGAEVMRRLRADEDPSIAQIPAIMLTGHAGEQSELRCLEAGADDFVTKPINLPILSARIETQLRLRSLREQLQRQNDELEAWRENLERDLAAARLTQQSLIPQKPPSLDGWETASVYRPVIQVGGDIYGWLRLGDGRTLYWIADATGHGAAAALITTLSKLLFQHGSDEHSDPAAIMETVNDDFRSIFGARSFMTAMCVALDAENGKASIVGAGHPPLLVIRANGAVETISSSAPPLGLVERSQFSETQLDLAPGDAFLLYTDGLYGADDEGEGRMTIEKLAELIPRHCTSAEELLAATLETIAPDETEQPDDIAAVAVRRVK